MNHIMLDLETLGTDSYSAILSIGAVKFDIENGQMGQVFYQAIDLKSCLKAGMKINADTFYWWLSQDNGAREGVLVQKRKALQSALNSFTQFYKGEYIWGNSASFDCGLLGNAYELLDLEKPWKFQKEMDFRTITNICRPELEYIPFVGTPHHPVDDCIHQIKVLANAYKMMGK